MNASLSSLPREAILPQYACDGKLRACRKSEGLGTFIPMMTPIATDSNDPDQLVSVSDAASRLDISLRSLYRIIARRELPAPVKVGRLSKLCESDLNSYIQHLKSQRS